MKLLRALSLRRDKIWLQRGPVEEGFRRYWYTGWQWKVLPATVDVALCPEVLPVADAFDRWCEKQGVPKANHYIVTAYEDGQHSIRYHFDKARSMDPKSLIVVVKLGTHGRPFAVRKRVDKKQQEKEPGIFRETLAPGTAVIMNMTGNLSTQHAVPEVEDAGMSGSIVFRTIVDVIPPAQVEKELAKRGVKRQREEG